MGTVRIREAAAPATPSEGFTLYAPVATPSRPTFVDKAGVTYVIATLERAQSFTGAQTFAPTLTGVNGILVNMPASTAGFALATQYNGANRQLHYATAAANAIDLLAFDDGASIGPFVSIRNNNNGSTPAAGSLLLYTKSGVANALWVDNASNVRIGAGAPTSATDTSGGTVVGTQTSMAEAKLISDDLSVLAEVMSRIRAGADAVRRFTYRSGSFNNETFEGVVIDHAPAYGMDKDEDHPAGKSLNEINIAGDLLRFASWAMQRIEELTARVAELEGARIG